MGQKFALIIGNSEYQDSGLAKLRSPELDAYDFAGALRSPDIGIFDEVITLFNEVEANVRRAIARFFGGKKPDDLLLLYFSGHGVRDDQGQLHLAVKDTERALLSATAIPAAFITEQMNNSRSRRQVLILDCCNSGAFAHGTKGATGASMGTATAFEGTGYGRVVLTATDATQYAWEGDQVIGEAENSVFTHYLVKGLETGEADADRDGWITLDEWYDYVYEQVVSQTPKQTPGKWSYKQQGEIVIARNPHPRVKPVAQQLETQPAVDPAAQGIAARWGKELSDQLKTEAERLAREKADQERQARDRAEAERLAAQRKSEALRLTAPAKTNWSAIAQKALGWGAAWGLGWSINLSIILLVFGSAGGHMEVGAVVAAFIGGALGGGLAGTVAGFITLLALRQAEPLIRWKQIWMAAISWAIGGPLSGAMCGAVAAGAGWAINALSGESSSASSLGEALGQAIGQAIVVVLFAFLGAIIGWGVVGVISGWRTGLAMQRADPTIRRGQMVGVALGWGFSALLAAVISLIILTVVGDALVGG